MNQLRDKYLTSFEVAELLGFTPDHVRRMICNGKIKAIKLGHNWLIDPKDLKGVRRVRFAKSKE